MASTTTWYPLNWVGTATSVTHSVELAASVPAKSTLFYVEARVMIGLSSNGIANTAGVFSYLTDGMAIAGVGSGAGAPDFDTIGEFSSCIWWGGKAQNSDNIVWAPSTAEGFWLPYSVTTIRWRGARFFSSEMDWYFVAENEVGNDTSASGFFRLGFWEP